MQQPVPATERHGLAHFKTEIVFQGTEVGAVHQGVAGHYAVIVDANVQERGDQPDNAVKQTVHAKGTEHIARQHHASLGPDFRHLTALKNRVIHEKAGLVFINRFLHQHHLAGNHRHCGIPSPLHGTPVHRVAERIVPQCPPVPVGTRLHIHHGVIVGPLAQRPDQVIVYPLGPHRRDVIRHLAHANALDKPDTLNARVVAVDVHLIDVLAPLLAGNAATDSEQPGAAGQHLLVIEQTLFNGSSQLKGLGTEAGLGAIFHQADGQLPEQNGGND